MNVEQDTTQTPDVTPDTTAAPATPPVEEKPSEADLMGDAYDNLVNKDGTIKDEKPKPAPKKEAKADPEPPKEDKPVESAPKEADKASLEGEEGADEDESGSSTPSDRSESAPVPAHLPKALKDAWGKMEPDVQKVIEEREREFGTRFSEMGREIEKVKPLSEKLNGMIEQYPALKDRTPEQLAQGATELAAVQMELDKNPLETVLKIAQTYGVIPQLKQAFSGQQPTNEQATIGRLNQQVAQLERQLQNAPNNQPNVDELVDSRFEQRDAEKAVADFAARNEQTYNAVEAVLPQFIEIARNESPNATLSELLQRGHDLAVNAFNVNGAKAPEPGNQDTAKAAPDPSPEAEAKNSKRTVKAIKAASINHKSEASSERPPKTNDELMGDIWDKHHAS